MQIQQGDVLLEKIEVMPNDVKVINPTEKGYVLAEGEATGHAHRITEIDSNICQLYEKDGALYVKALKPVVLKHEEHKQITIEEGIWKIGKVNEYDYISKITKKVVD